MSGIDNEDSVKLEADRARLDISYAGEQQRRKNLAIAQPPMDSRSDFFQQFFARRLFEEADQGFNLRFQMDQARRQFGFGGGHLGQASEEGQIARAEGGASSGCRS